MQDFFGCRRVENLMRLGKLGKITKLAKLLNLPTLYPLHRILILSEGFPRSAKKLAVDSTKPYSHSLIFLLAEEITAFCRQSVPDTVHREKNQRRVVLKRTAATDF